MTKAYRRSGGLAVLAAAAAIGLAACGGSSTPHVASLGRPAAAPAAVSPTTTLPKGNPTQLLDEWADLHAQPRRPRVRPTRPSTPTRSSTSPCRPSARRPVAARSAARAASQPCGAYLTAASTALRGGQPLQKPDPAKLLKFSQCMRANGIPDFPDPSRRRPVDPDQPGQ